MQLSYFSMMLVASGVSGGLSGASKLLHDYSSDGQGMAMTFSGAAPTLRITDTTTPSNNWDSGLGTGYTVQDFFKSRSFTSYTGPVGTGKRLMQADGYIKPCRHNLLAMSSKFESSKWVAANLTVTPNSAEAPDGTMTAALLSPSANPSIYQAVVAAPGGGLPLTFSVYLKSATGASFNIAYYANGSGVSPNPTTGTLGTVTTSWQRFSVTVTCAASSATINFALGDFTTGWASGNNVYAWGAQVNFGSQALDYVSSEAHNLTLYSEQLDNAAWSELTVDAIAAGTVVAPDGTSTAETITATAGSNRHAVAKTSAITSIANIGTCVSIYVKAGTSNYCWIGLYGGGTDYATACFDLSDGLSTASETFVGTTGAITATAKTALANSWYRISISCSVAAASVYPQFGFAQAATGNTVISGGYISFNAAGTETQSYWGAQVELSSAPGKYVATTAAAVYNPHFDIPIEYNTDGTVKALRREEARTNYFLYSNDHDNAAFWAVAQASVSANAVASIDGLTNADKIVEDSTTNVHSLYGSYIAGASGNWTYSAYIRSAERSRLNINMTDNVVASFSADYDIASNTILTNPSNAGNWTNTAATITDINGVWSKLTLSGSLSTSATISVYISLISSGITTSYLGDGSSGLYICYSQFENGLTSSSPIVTGSAAVTRAADHIYWATTIAPFSTSEVTLYGKELILNTPSSTDTICALNANGSYGSGGGLLMRITSLISSQVGGNSSSVSKAISPAATVGGTVKVAGGAKVSTTTQAVTNSGQSVATDATCDWTGTSNRVVIGNIQDGAQPGRQGLVEFMLLPTYDTTIMQNVTA